MIYLFVMWDQIRPTDSVLQMMDHAKVSGTIYRESTYSKSLLSIFGHIIMSRVYVIV